LGDLLQRYNVQLLHPESDGSEEAEKLGKEWIERNQSFLKESSISLIRWREILENSELAEKVREIYAVYDSVSEEGQHLRDIIDETAEKFTDRYCDESADANGVTHLAITDATERARIKESSMKYIKEELAYLIVYAIKNRISYFLYPGDETDCPAFTEARKIFLRGEDQDLLQWVKVTFKTPKLRTKLSGRGIEYVADSAAVPSDSASDDGSDHSSGFGSPLRQRPRRNTDATVIEIDSLRRRMEEKMEEMRKEFVKELHAMHMLLIAVVSGREPPRELLKVPSSPTLADKYGGFFQESGIGVPSDVRSIRSPDLSSVYQK